jgi:hypothetical protein
MGRFKEEHWRQVGFRLSKFSQGMGRCARQGFIPQRERAAREGLGWKIRRFQTKLEEKEAQKEAESAMETTY